MSTISFSGLASGIDGDAVIKAIIDSRKLVSVPIQNKVTANEDENKALEEFNTKLLALGDAARSFMTLGGGAVSKSVSSSIEDVATASATNAALTGSTSLTVKALAKAATISFTDTFPAIDQPIFPSLAAESTIEITLGQGENQKVYSVPIDNQTTLSSLALTIGDLTEGKVQASAINLNAGNPAQYALVMQGGETGLQKGSISIVVPPEAGALQSSTIDQATNALVNISGVGDIVRSTNNLTDVLPGISINLKQVSPVPVLISVSSDSKKTADQVGKLIQAFNEVIKYSRENSKIERIESSESGKDSITNVYSSLARARVDELAVDDLRAALAGSRAEVGDSVRVLSDLGITTQRDGTLGFDDKKFMEAVDGDPTSAQKLLTAFADKLGSADGVVAQYTKFQGQIDIAIQANTDENESMNERLTRITTSLDKQTEMLKRTFASLESQVGKLNSDQSALTAILAGLSND